MKNKRTKGLTLLESVLAAAILVIIAVPLLVFMRQTNMNIVKARQRFSAQRTAEFAISRLKNIGFYYLIDVDSCYDKIGFGFPPGSNFKKDNAFVVPGGIYPYRSVLDEIQTTIEKSGFDCFIATISYFNRDKTDDNHNGSLADLIEFQPNGAMPPSPATPLCDKHEPNICFKQDITAGNGNNDHDYYDIWTANLGGGTVRTFTEVPDTNLRQINFRIFKDKQVVGRQTVLVNNGQWTGQELSSAENPFELQILLPSAGSTVLYEDIPTKHYQATARALGILKTYPLSVQAFQADSTHDLDIKGFSAPSATIDFEVSPTATINFGQVSVKATFHSDGNGHFMNGDPLNLASVTNLMTTSLVEGPNIISAYAYKPISGVNYYSPKYFATFILDQQPPLINNLYPQGSTNDRTFYIRADLIDLDSANTSVGASGICTQVTSLLIDGTAVVPKYDVLTGKLNYFVVTSLLGPGNHDVYLDGGDNARFKVIKTWHFNVHHHSDPGSPPVVTYVGPASPTSIQQPKVQISLQDPESGIKPDTITMDIDGTQVVSVTNVDLYFDPQSGILAYTPAYPLSAGGHLITVQADHWGSAGPATTSQTFTLVEN